MMNLRPFQLALLGGFAFVSIAALVIFGTYDPPDKTEQSVYGSEVIIWGTLPEDVFTEVFRGITREDKLFDVVKYYQVDERSFDDELINAIAEGRSPDMVVLASENLVKHRAKLFPISYESLPLRDYRTAYVDGAEIFARADGVYAVPFAVDPMMMYWNRDLFASNALAQAPRNWAEVVSSVVPSITSVDSSLNIITSALAFGEFRNVTHAKEVLMLLLLQSGSEMVTEGDRGYVMGLDKSLSENSRAPLDAALKFYTDFSNPTKSTYTWNRAMKQDLNAFISGDLALYFGLGSEAENIYKKNANLNYDVTMVPQGSGATALRTYGTFYGFAIPRAAPNMSGAYAAMNTISSARYADGLTRGLNLAPVRRDLIAQGDSEPYRASILQSALIARSWLDPDPVESSNIFMQMVEDVVSNRSRYNKAISDAINRLKLEY
ncbi:MAG: ABC-type glycerol-3-phosphate transport system substrate-binding protein [Acidimicrobiales bacterium]|jgi:ABC-type glycerol-3-phosphate transport system substrate-binding protein